MHITKGHYHIYHDRSIISDNENLKPFLSIIIPKKKKLETLKILIRD